MKELRPPAGSRLLAVILAVLIAIVLAEACPLIVSADASNGWTISKSKTAENLNSDFKSDITVSLPSSEEQLTTEIAFVLDESSFSDTHDSAVKLLDALKTHAGHTGAKVQVDIIGFKRAAYNHGSFDLSTQYEKIQDAFNKQNSGGSNLHAGLLMAKEILAKNTSIPDSRKYMILVSDGDTYLYCKNGNYNVPYSRSYIPLDQAKGFAYGGFYDESWYYPSQPYEGNVKRPSDSNADSWKNYLADVKARNEESHGDSYDYVWKYYDGWQTVPPTDSEFKTQPSIPRSASNMDMAFLYAADTYHELAAKYNCYSVAVQSLNKVDGGHPAFMEYLNNGKKSDFSSIQNETLYLLGPGSTVENHVGYVEGNYNFDLTDPSKMTLTANEGNNGDSAVYTAEKIAENHYGFKKNDNTSESRPNYDYEVEYTPGNKKDDEHFIWKINVPVSNFTRVSLHYTIKLMNPKTTPGTFGIYDRDGSLGQHGLHVSRKAILKPVDSNGKMGTEENFRIPTVCYTVKEPYRPDPEPEKRTIKLEKKWITDDGGTPAKSVKIKILKDGSEYRTVTLSAENSWTWTESVAKDNAVYTAKELTNVNGFESSVKSSNNGDTITVINDDVKRTGPENTGGISNDPDKPDISAVTPSTGDDRHTFLYGSLCILSAAVLAILILIKRKSA